MILHFEALVITAIDISRERRPANLEHRGANSALEIMNTEPTLQLGTLADACEIVVRSNRFLGKECFDILALPSHTQALDDSAIDLFTHGGCMKRTGYTP